MGLAHLKVPARASFVGPVAQPGRALDFYQPRLEEIKWSRVQKSSKITKIEEFDVESLVRPIIFINHSQITKKQLYIIGETKLAKKKAKTKINISKHVLIPKHTKLSEKDKKDLFERYNISVTQLPKIKLSDPAIASLDLKVGDVVKIIRQSKTAGEAVFFRGVIDG